MRMIVRNIINSESKSLKEMGLENKKVKMVYTIINEDNMYAKFNPYTGESCNKSLDNLILTHGITVFAEDVLHDWKISGNIFKYNSHSTKIDQKVDLLIEYE